MSGRRHSPNQARKRLRCLNSSDSPTGEHIRVLPRWGRSLGIRFRHVDLRERLSLAGSHPEARQADRGPCPSALLGLGRVLPHRYLGRPERHHLNQHGSTWAPRAGNCAMKTRLYARTPEHPAVLARARVTIRPVQTTCREDLAQAPRNPQRPHAAGRASCALMTWSVLHGDVQRQTEPKRSAPRWYVDECNRKGRNGREGYHVYARRGSDQRRRVTQT